MGSGEWRMGKLNGRYKMGEQFSFFNHLILNSERQTSSQVAGGTRASFLF